MKGEVVLVAVDARIEITDYALEWTVRNVIKAMDSLILLAILPSNGCSPASGNSAHQSQVFIECQTLYVLRLLRKWGLRSGAGRSVEQLGLSDKAWKHQENRKITEVCQRMMRKIFLENKIRKVQTQVKVVTDAVAGSVATHAGELGATWVILDRRLKKEGEYCSKQLNCNIVIIDHAIPKILKSINSQSQSKIKEGELQNDLTEADMLGISPPDIFQRNGESSLSTLGFSNQNSKIDASHSSPSTGNAYKTMKNQPNVISLHQYSQLVHQDIETEVVYQSIPSSTKSQPLDKVSMYGYGFKEMHKTKTFSGPLKNGTGITGNPPMTLLTTSRRSTGSSNMQWNPSPSQVKRPAFIRTGSRDGNKTNDSIPKSSSSSIRAMSVSVKPATAQPPLCSICKNNAPIVGKSPRKYSYSEIQRATDGFSAANFLAEGGFGPVYKGVMPDGQVVAVKQHKLLSAQGASEFCSEVEVLSCAQHKNLVMLVGYCIDKEWLLVYQFACNGSLDKHLYASETMEVMTWESRMKVAVGAARGLRYLHEDCRIGCIVHRDVRPKNILLTHDFEPMVGDFGLARCQANGQSAEETRVVGSFGYLSPEYAQTGLITQKTDVYAFGVVLLELLTGLKATDLNRSEEKHYLPEWGQKLLHKTMLSEILDPRLNSDYVDAEVKSMILAASLCISTCPEKRPRMSKVLRILEGGMNSEMTHHKRQNSYSKRRSYDGTQGHRTSHLIKPMLHMKLSSSNIGVDGNNSNKMEFKPKASLEKYGIDKVDDGWCMDLSEDFVSEEYQTYLQGSLAKFVQKEPKAHESKANNNIA